MNVDRPAVLVRAMTQDGSARALAIDATAIVRRAQEISGSSPVITAAYGRALTAASLMGSLQKDPEDEMTLQIRGDGPAGTIVTASDYSGNVRGYVENPRVELPLAANGKLAVGRAVGEGLLILSRKTGMGGEPYTAQNPLVSGEIAEDIAHYYATSEQIPTLIGLGVLVGPDESCLAAGGFLIQLLPYADEEIIPLLERNASAFGDVSRHIAEGMTPQQMLEALLKDIPFDLFDELEVGYRCPCTRERTERALISLGRQQLQELIDNDHGAQLTCRFCDNVYDYSEEELKKLLAQAL
ncbi:MAG: Hsp33 family molecular chaperone HslO [Clostridia bacterium]|nr:Hsp33 family molecular chaperone HslO [Clostridia bacterium]